MVRFSGELGEFCDEALEDVEANGYNLAEQIIVGTILSLQVNMQLVMFIVVNMKDEHDDDHDDDHND